MHTMGIRAIIQKREHSDEHIDIEKLLFLNYGKLVICANKFLNDSELSRSVVQEALLKLWKDRHEFEQLYSAISFLYKKKRNDCLKKILKIYPENYNVFMEKSV